MFFLPIKTIFKLNCRIQKTNVLTKFHEDWEKICKTASPPGGHVFPPIMTIFELVRDIYKIDKTHVLTKFHEDWTKNVTSRVENCHAPGGHVFSPIWTIYELIRDINDSNVLAKFHDDWAKIVTSRVNTAPPRGSHLHEDWALNVTSIVFELSRGINGTNVLTKFHEDQKTNVASRVFTRQNIDAARRTKGDHKCSPSAQLSTLCS
ncbi:hypothetical protein DPMN_011470, partial [Dreissena polymorpha]